MKIKTKLTFDQFLNTIFSVILFLFIYLVIGFYISGSRGLEIGTISDLVSSLCNIIMAAVAVYAAYKAKNLLSPKLHNDAYELSKKIVVFQMHDLIIQASSTLSSCFEIRKVLSEREISNDKLCSTLDTLIKNITSLQNLQSSIEADFRIMNKLGFSLSKGLRTLYGEHTRAINDYMSSVIQCSAFSLTLLNDSDNSVKKSNLNNEITTLTHLHLDCSRTHIEFYYHKDGFFDYFESNKGKND